MYCPNCGKDNNGNKFCSNCGCLLDNNIQFNNNIQNNKGEDYKTISLVLGIICLVMSFFTGILCLIPGIISIVLAVKYKKESGKLGVGFGLSLGGIIFSVVITILFSVFMFMAYNMVESRNNYDNTIIEDSYNYGDFSEFYYIPYVK